MSELLSPRFLAELEAYRRRFGFPVRSGAAGARGSKHGGSSAEFLEHREYAPGDDARRIDWSAFARSRKVVIKRFRAEEDAWIRLLLDASGSMAFGEPTKYVHAQRICAALGYLALAQGERVDACVASKERARTEVLRGAAARAPLLKTLDSRGPRGQARLAEVLRASVAQSKHHVAFVVVSDFLEPEVIEALRHAAARGHLLVLLQVLSPSEIDPALFGDFNLQDAETGQTLPFSADDLSLAEYRRALGELQDTLRRIAHGTRGRFELSAAGEPVAELLQRLIAA